MKLLSIRSRLWAGSVVVAAAAIGAALLVDLPSQTRADSPKKAAAPAVPVSVAVVEPKATVAWDEFSGRLEAVERVDVRSRVAGAVQAVHFREGALVKQGDLLITIDPAPYRAEVDRLQAQVVAAEARLSFTKGEVDRGQPLLGRARRVAARLRRAHQRVSRSRRQPARGARRRCRPPAEPRLHRGARAGVGPRRTLEITVGNLVAAGPGAPVLTTLVSVNPDLRQLQRRRAGGDAGAAAPSIATRAGAAQIEQIPVQMGTASQQGDADPRPPAADRQPGRCPQRHGARARRVRQPGRAPDARPVRAAAHGPAPRRRRCWLVNERAIGTDQNKKFVMVVGQSNKAAYREVTLGAFVDGLRVVTSGPEGRRAHRRQRPAARAPGRAGGAASRCTMDGQAASQARTTPSDKAVLR